MVAGQGRRVMTSCTRGCTDAAAMHTWASQLQSPVRAGVCINQGPATVSPCDDVEEESGDGEESSPDARHDRPELDAPRTNQMLPHSDISN